MNEFKPCPFCGGEAEMDTQRAYRPVNGGPSGNEVAIYCTGCPADVSFSYEDVPELTSERLVATVTDMWNARVTADQDADMTEQKRKPL